MLESSLEQRRRRGPIGWQMVEHLPSGWKEATTGFEPVMEGVEPFPECQSGAFDHSAKSPRALSPGALYPGRFFVTGSDFCTSLIHRQELRRGAVWRYNPP